MSSVTFSNHTALVAGSYLSQVHERLRRSLGRLSSGNKIDAFFEDPGGLAVASKLRAAIRQNQATHTSVQNALSFLQTQEGIFQIATFTLTRMAQLATLAQDITKNEADLANYNAEFQGLQKELVKLSEENFNGIPLFVRASSGVTPSSTAEKQLGVITSLDGTQSTAISVAPLATSPWMNMLLKGFVSFADPGDSSRRIFVPNPPQDVNGYLEDESEFDLDQSVVVTQTWRENFTLPAGWSSRSATIPADTYTANSGAGPVNLPTSTAVTVAASLASPAATLVSGTTYELNTPTNSPYVTNPTYRQLAENFRNGTYIDPLHAGTTTSSSVTVQFAPPVSYTRVENGSTTTAITLDNPSESVTLTQTLDPWSSNPLSESAANVSSGDLTKNTAKEMGVITAKALQSLSQMRAANGAQQSRLGFATDNLSEAGTQMDAALSRITDVDVAFESTQLARLTILQESGAAMLLQANATHQSLMRSLFG